MKIACVQMRSTEDPYENLLLVDAFVKEAERQGVDLVCFPENVFYRGPKRREGWTREEIFLSFEGGNVVSSPESHQDFAQSFAELSQNWRVGVSLGSVIEKSDAELPYNTHVFWDPDQASFQLYRKIHLFHFDGETASYAESRDFEAGDQRRMVNFRGFRIGLSICFDLRFPELFREYAIEDEAQVLLIPSAFASETGKQHWHSLLKARAIENQCHVVASAQWGTHLDSRSQNCECYGHGLVVGPWGESLADLGAEGDRWEIIELAPEALRGLRKRLPVLSSARFRQSLAKSGT